MIKIFTLVLFFLGFNGLSPELRAQVNPSAAILPVNAGGIVAQGAVMDIKVTISNTGTGNIVASKLRPNISMPPIVAILPTAQQTGLPPNWSVVSNTGNGQIRICNGTDVIAGGQSRDIFIKVQGVTIGGPSSCEVQIQYGGASCASVGPQPSGNNGIDDFAASSVTVAPGCPLTLTASAGNILCAGGTTTITANATGATGPIEYSITGGVPFQPGNTFTNVTAGNYAVTAREVNNPLSCSVTTNLSITEPAPVEAPALSIVQPTCLAANALVTLTSSVGNLTFSIDGGTYAAYPAGGYSLPAGSHSIIARNENNCVSGTTDFVINAQPSTASAPIAGAVTQPDCSVSTGTVVLNGLPAGNWTIQPGTVTGNTGSTLIAGLAAGTYVFTVTNDQGCTSAPSGSVVINAVPGAPDAPLVNTIQPGCTSPVGGFEITSPVTGLTFSLDGAAYSAYPAGGYTGVLPGTHTLIAQNSSGCLSPVTTVVIQPQPLSPAAPVVNVQQPTCSIAMGTITVTSPTAGFTFSLDGGPFEPYPVAGYMVNAGTHSLAVANTSGCAPNTTNNILLNAQPASPSVLATFTPVTCFGSNSIITVTASGGVAAYEYSINGGPYQNTSSFTVSAGNYVVTVKDANGCTGSSNLSITEPAAINATASASAIACNGGNSILTVAATGGSGTYEYSLNNGPYQPGNIFTVAAGTYNVQVRLANNPSCTSATGTVVNITQPARLKITANADAIAFCGGNTTARITATGGTAPYTGTGNFIKGPGIWSFVVVDAGGCTDTAEVNILPPGCIEIEVFPNPSRDFINVHHSPASGTNSYLQIFAENGAAVLTHRVPQHAFFTRLNIEKLAAGYYLVLYINGDDRKETKFIKTTK